MDRKLGWKAVYPDKVIEQYPKGKPETLISALGNWTADYKLGNNLPRYFYIGAKYGVDLIEGRFLLDGKWYQFADKEGTAIKPINLIYYRIGRASLTIGRNFKKFLNIGGLNISVSLPPPKTIQKFTHCLGYEYNKGTIIVRISETGNALVCLEASNG